MSLPSGIPERNGSQERQILLSTTLKIVFEKEGIDSAIALAKSRIDRSVHRTCPRRWRNGGNLAARPSPKASSLADRLPITISIGLRAISRPIGTRESWTRDQRRRASNFKQTSWHRASSLPAGARVARTLSRTHVHRARFSRSRGKHGDRENRLIFPSSPDRAPLHPLSLSFSLSVASELSRLACCCVTLDVRGLK